MRIDSGNRKNQILIAGDFFVLDKGKEKYFYIACNFPEERIDVFKMPKIK